LCNKTFQKLFVNNLGFFQRCLRQKNPALSQNKKEDKNSYRPNTRNLGFLTVSDGSYQHSVDKINGDRETFNRINLAKQQ